MPLNLVREPLLPNLPDKEELKDTEQLEIFLRDVLLVLEEMHEDIFDDLTAGGGMIDHHGTHEDGGTDEISVAGLSGVLADKQDADKLQARNVDSAAPSDGDVLTWDDGNSKWKPVAPAAGGGPPIGAILPYGGAAAPTGYLMCDGSAVSRTTYSDLFTIIGTAYGVGDGSTTFNLPDLRQRFPMGKSASESLGDTGGAFDHTHSVPSLAFDTFSVTSRAIISQIAVYNNILYQLGTSGTYSTLATHSYTSSGVTGGNNPPYQVVNYIIKY